ncbi:L-histidine N(alpha)-methyltransferase [Carboxylicivirga taeanensis]|uniref:L-histidine N(alpha)-methyltransferase n=1 Tax=Carboxylicivirga taeanensis TaxID=1416875 RepID=UPI003F6DDF65
MPDKLINNKNKLLNTSENQYTNGGKQEYKQTLRQELIQGLTAEQKYVSSKFFYDRYGSQLFNWITQLPEYYLTKAEKSILKKYRKELFAHLSHVNIIELGSGDSSKISLVLETIPQERHSHIHYFPIDVSDSSIRQSKNTLNDAFPNIKVQGIATDFTWLNTLPNERPRIICFFGSTVGNFELHKAEALLKNLQQIMNPGDQLILGLDLVKDSAILELAYNDSQRITEAFNKNILRACNALLNSNIQPADFEHKAFFNAAKSRVEMHLIAQDEIIITSPYLKECIELSKGESIHTENSFKYSLEMIENLSAQSKLPINRIFYDDQKWFALVQFIK